ncbi:MAG: FtsW/RodA/SpoVE family cell cycle protein [Clostridia bacterium]|nr:FtsW/RodA/SpoVE family cell cycle protein [Clostridia bacterium]
MVRDLTADRRGAADGRPLLFRGRPDTLFTVLVFILLLLGTVVLMSASSTYTGDEGDSPFGEVRSHLLHMAIGFLAMIPCILFVTPALVRRLTPAFGAVSFIGLLVVLAAGTADGIAKRWIFIGPISIQPSEFAKTAVILLSALVISSGRGETGDQEEERGMKRWLRTFFIPMAITGAACLLILLEHHLSGFVITAAIGIFMTFAGGAAVFWELAVIGAGAGLVWLAVQSGYTSDRVTSWLHRGADLKGIDWQTTQGIYAIGSGGLFGKGIGESLLKYGYVSEVANDFIFTVVCEELGFFGATGILLIFAAAVFRGFVLGFKCRDRFASLVILGLSFKFGIHVLLNVMVVTGLIPNTGISLPFFSSGGSATLMQMFDAGLLLGLSRYCDP